MNYSFFAPSLFISIFNISAAALLFACFISSIHHKNNNFMTNVEAMIIDPLYQLLDASDFAIISPSTGGYFLGEYSVGVNSSLGCGRDDPVGKLATSSYVEVDFPTPVTNMYYLRIRAYSPNTLANSMWMWFRDGAFATLNGTSPFVKTEVDTSFSSTKLTYITEDTICMRMSATTTVNNTMRFYPREPGVLIAWVNMTMIPPPQILRAFSTCSGDCNLDNPLPIRVEFSPKICGASNRAGSSGDIVIKGPGGSWTCSWKTQGIDAFGVAYVDCLIPTNITQGTSNLAASLNWPQYAGMPTVSANVPITVPQKTENMLWVIAPAVVGVIIIAIVARHFYKKWAATKNAPRDANNFSAMFISARKISLLWERAPLNTGEALKVYDRIVRAACDQFDCYISKKIGDSYLVVANDPAQNISASAEIQRELQSINWYKVFTGNDVPPKIVPSKKKNSKQNRPGGSNKNTIEGEGFHDTIGSYRSGTRDDEGEGDLSFNSPNQSTKQTHSATNSTDPDSAAPPAPIATMDGSGRGTVVVSRTNSKLKTPKSADASKRSVNHASESVRSESAGTHTSQLTRTIVEIGIQCSIAIARGKGRIQSHEAGTVADYETFEYSGDVVDQAAMMVDLAHPRQIVTIESVQHAVHGREQGQDPATHAAESSSLVAGSFSALAAKLIKAKNYKFVQYNPAGLDILGCGLQEESDNTDSMQAQLDAASSGFAQKMCTILYLEFEGLIEQAEAEDDKKSFLEKYTLLYKPVNDAVKQLGGTLVNITSSNLVVAWNAFSPSPMHVTRAATCYFRLRDIFSNPKLHEKFSVSKLGFCAGLSTGNCLVGTLESDKSHKQIFGGAWEQSQELMRLARVHSKAKTLSYPCLAIWNSRSDLNHNTQFQFIDIVTSRRAQPNSQSQQLQQQTSPKFLRGIISLAKPSDDNDDDDREWMYDLEHNEGNNPYNAANEAYVWLLGDFVGDALERWNSELKPKLQQNAENEVAVLQMVGLQKLAEIFQDGWEIFAARLQTNDRL